MSSNSTAPAEGDEGASASSVIGALWLLALLIPCVFFYSVRLATVAVYARRRSLQEDDVEREADPRDSYLVEQHENVAYGRELLGGQAKREDRSLQVLSDLEKHVTNLRRVNPELRRRLRESGRFPKMAPALGKAVHDALQRCDQPQIVRIPPGAEHLEGQIRRQKRIDVLQQALLVLREENREAKRLLSQGSVLSTPQGGGRGRQKKTDFADEEADVEAGGPAAAARDEGGDADDEREPSL